MRDAVALSGLVCNDQGKANGVSGRDRALASWAESKAVNQTYEPLALRAMGAECIVVAGDVSSQAAVVQKVVAAVLNIRIRISFQIVSLQPLYHPKCHSTFSQTRQEKVVNAVCVQHLLKWSRVLLCGPEHSSGWTLKALLKVAMFCSQPLEFVGSKHYLRRPISKWRKSIRQSNQKVSQRCDVVGRGSCICSVDSSRVLNGFPVLNVRSKNVGSTTIE